MTSGVNLLHATHTGPQETASMDADKLAKVYLDNQPLDLAEAQPRIAAILFASGKPNSTSVQWLTSRSDPKGKTMLPDDVVDRTAEPATPIYLTSVDAGTFGRKGDSKDASEVGAAPAPGRDSRDARADLAGKAGSQPGQADKQGPPSLRHAGSKPRRSDGPAENQDQQEDEPTEAAPAPDRGPTADQDAPESEQQQEQDAQSPAGPASRLDQRPASEARRRDDAPPQAPGSGKKRAQEAPSRARSAAPLAKDD